MILVFGSGRSGTSAVAQILHEDLGVNMGHVFHLGDRFNPQGYYEDREFQSVNLSFYLMHLDTIDDEKPWKLWRERWYELLSQRKEPWGIKDPSILDVDRLIAQYLELKPHVIICERDYEDTIQSYKRFKNVRRKEAKRIIDQRLKAIENIDTNKLSSIIYIDCYDDDKDKKLEEWYNKVYKFNNIKNAD